MRLSPGNTVEWLHIQLYCITETNRLSYNNGIKNSIAVNI